MRIDNGTYKNKKACTKTRNSYTEHTRNSPGQHRTARNTRGKAQNTYGTAQNTRGTAYSSCLFILNGGIYFTNNEIASELLNYIINQVQSSHYIKWMELTMMLTGQLPKHNAKKLCLSFSPADM